MSNEKQNIIRSFIALPISEELRLKISEIQESLRPFSGEIKWEPVEKLHLTLKFLGNSTVSQLDQINVLLSEKITQTYLLELCAGGLGGFPSINSARVLWMGVRLTDELNTVFKEVENAAKICGFEKEARAFHSHITVGRNKQIKLNPILIERIKKVTFEPIVFNCSKLHIMKSFLKKTGSEYSIVHTINFKQISGV
jgi:2'-5' RNA ligase